MKRLVILGSTGSIGVSTLDIVANHPTLFSVRGLAAGRQVEKLAQQVKRFQPEWVSVADAEAAERLADLIDDGPRIVHGPEGLLEIVGIDDVEMVVSAIVGAAGMPPTLRALAKGVDVALANKEALVVAGRHMTAAAHSAGARILPVDSEHNALHQCLRGEDDAEVAALWLTASGGPFRGRKKDELTQVTAEQALAHPTWEMGPKISIDSATLMNKGLEVIEAHWLFGLPPERIRVVVHPQSVVHSMVEFVDGSFKAQLGVADMRHPIQYALTWPERRAGTLDRFDPVAVSRWTFEEPDLDAFPCLSLAYAALRQGGAACAILNAANEVAVDAFLAGKIGFAEIPKILSAVMLAHRDADDATIERLLEADAAARETAWRFVEQGVCT
ncbi:MAG: 1-deoxy-D-xylulose-5-phosphate reductoisomerase [Acidobacteriota bacterium]|nr:1-deoxy-D-xylulose-5-phosphate reductoisomerase [Acidobacteriota bacterium]